MPNYVSWTISILSTILLALFIINLFNNYEQLSRQGLGAEAEKAWSISKFEK